MPCWLPAGSPAFLLPGTWLLLCRQEEEEAVSCYPLAAAFGVRSGSGGGAFCHLAQKICLIPNLSSTLCPLPPYLPTCQGMEGGRLHPTLPTICLPRPGCLPPSEGGLVTLGMPSYLICYYLIPRQKT